MQTPLDREIDRQRLKDEYNSLGAINISMLPGESYEDNLRRRAEISLRRDAILSTLYDS